MSVPTFNLYDFIYNVTEKKFWVKYFSPWGSKDLITAIDLLPYDNPIDEEVLANTEYKDTCYSKTKLHPMVYQNTSWANFQPTLFCHDQEPLQFAMYKDDFINPELLQKWSRFRKYVKKDLNLRHTQPRSCQQYWILLHSELNSQELTNYENSGMFIGAYWWSHALIAIDWYRYAKHDSNLQRKQIEKLFLVYCRDTTGSRQYRKDFLKLLKDNKIDDKCFFGNANDSNKSAEYSWKDITSTGVHVILETVFDQRIHLTEKTLRPIACGQPFILANGPGSLEYLKTYGFKTFSPWINESYDLEYDATTRLLEISNEMRRLALLPPDELNMVIAKCNEIAEYNKQLFFSDDFFNKIILELKENVEQAYHKSNNKLDWKVVWNEYKFKKSISKNQNWQTYRPYFLHLIKHIRKGGTLEDYVPPDLD